MKPTTIMILGAAAYVGYLLLSDGKSKASITLKSAANKLKIKWNSGVPTTIPQDGNALTTQVNYYTSNPNASIYGVLFPNL